MKGAVCAAQVIATAQPCVWMSARVLDYRLCDRDFDCQHCPLHAALAGAPILPTSAASRRSEGAPLGFPSDRLYSGGHTWISRPDPSSQVVRIGLDAFASSLIGTPRRVRRTPDYRIVERGEPLCEFDLDEGVLPIGSPLPGRMWESNAALADGIDLVVRDPYGAGWLAEVEVEPRIAPGGLFDRDEALRSAQLDAGRFCRGAAMRLLAYPRSWDLLPLSRVCGVANLHSALGAEGFMTLLRDLVH